MSLSGFQINPIDVNFHLQNSLEIFGKNSADKVWPKKDRGWKVPCLMPIRVKNSSTMYENTYASKESLRIQQNFLSLKKTMTTMKASK